MRCTCVQSSSTAGGITPRASSRRTPLTAAAAPAATPLPLLMFWQEFRSQVARLEGVEALPLPHELAAAQAAALPVSLRAGACHADRLRFGHFVYVNAAAMGKQRRRRRKQGDDAGSSSSSSSDGGNSSSSPPPLPGVSLLQGALLPSLFSFHPPLAFQALAFNGGQSWMVAIELGTLPLQEQAAEGQQAVTGSSGRGSSSSSSRAGDNPAAGAADAILGAAADAAAPTPEGWQAGQIARFAALRQLYSGIAAPLPAGSPLLQQATASQDAAAVCQQGQQLGAGRPLLLFSSAALQAAGLPPEASLERDGVTAFRQSLALHLNGLASAPADASPQHVRRMAAAQLAWLREQRRRPLLCAAHLEAAFGQDWLRQLQEHIAASSERGLPELLASSAGPAGQRQEQQQDEWVLVNPAQLLEGLA